jgi:hypothetical protein
LNNLRLALKSATSVALAPARNHLFIDDALVLLINPFTFSLSLFFPWQLISLILQILTTPTRAVTVPFAQDHRMPFVLYRCVLLANGNNGASFRLL